MRGHFTATFHLSKPISWENLKGVFNRETMQLQTFNYTRLKNQIGFHRPSYAMHISDWILQSDGTVCNKYEAPWHSSQYWCPQRHYLGKCWYLIYKMVILVLAACSYLSHFWTALGHNKTDQGDLDWFLNFIISQQSSTAFFLSIVYLLEKPNIESQRY